jgi:hypothetical protein
MDDPAQIINTCMGILDKLSVLLESKKTDLIDLINKFPKQNCKQGRCEIVSLKLKKYLEEYGYKPKLIKGFYTTASSKFQPDLSYDVTRDWTNDDWNSFERDAKQNKFDHFWLEVGGKIVDLTRKQFHPKEIVELIVDKNDKSYQKIKPI